MSTALRSRRPLMPLLTLALTILLGPGGIAVAHTGEIGHLAGQVVPAGAGSAVSSDTGAAAGDPDRCELCRWLRTLRAAPMAPLSVRPGVQPVVAVAAGECPAESRLGVQGLPARAPPG